ncbi:hypothetical protein EYC84_009043 [Monilinia fructicola]|uniref:O-methyltransferase C-terminal domain-containing protein n=1 Tax=Monilinia fructicola TaxID=38448 RepID=A0A5M9JB65_MONFR|nr:hypothetical protein EYC84_009043 [Monilinia fructicola]
MGSMSDLEIAFAKITEATKTLGVTIQRLIYLAIQPSLCRAGNYLNLFKILADNGRNLRFLASADIVTEVGEETFIADNVTKALDKSGRKAGMNHTFFIRTISYGTSHRFPIFRLAPEESREVGLLHGMDDCSTRRNGCLVGLIPLEESVKNIDPNRIIFVDVGGGIGHKCLELKTRFPLLQGQVILEDLPVTLEHALSKDGVKDLPQDIFTSRQVKNAKFYYMRNILHDWPEDKCKISLTHLRKAMGPDSAILIDEMILPNTGASCQAMSLDFTMMAALPAMERTKS